MSRNCAFYFWLTLGSLIIKQPYLWSDSATVLQAYEEFPLPFKKGSTSTIGTLMLEKLKAILLKAF